MNLEETTIEIAGKYGTIRAHFPRIGYRVKHAAGVKL